MSYYNQVTYNGQFYPYFYAEETSENRVSIYVEELSKTGEQTREFVANIKLEKAFDGTYNLIDVDNEIDIALGEYRVSIDKNKNYYELHNKEQFNDIFIKRLKEKFSYNIEGDDEVEAIMDQKYQEGLDIGLESSTDSLNSEQQDSDFIEIDSGEFLNLLKTGIERVVNTSRNKGYYIDMVHNMIDHIIWGSWNGTLLTLVDKNDKYFKVDINVYIFTGKEEGTLKLAIFGLGKTEKFISEFSSKKMKLDKDYIEEQLENSSKNMGYGYVNKSDFSKVYEGLEEVVDSLKDTIDFSKIQQDIIDVYGTGFKVISNLDGFLKSHLRREELCQEEVTNEEELRVFGNYMKEHGGFFSKIKNFFD